MKPKNWQPGMTVQSPDGECRVLLLRLDNAGWHYDFLDGSEHEVGGLHMWDKWGYTACSFQDKGEQPEVGGLAVLLAQYSHEGCPQPGDVFEIVKVGGALRFQGEHSWDGLHYAENYAPLDRAIYEAAQKQDGEPVPEPGSECADCGWRNGYHDGGCPRYRPLSGQTASDACHTWTPAEKNCKVPAPVCSPEPKVEKLCADGHVCCNSAGPDSGPIGPERCPACQDEHYSGEPTPTLCDDGRDAGKPCPVYGGEACGDCPNCLARAEQQEARDDKAAEKKAVKKFWSNKDRVKFERSEYEKWRAGKAMDVDLDRFYKAIRFKRVEYGGGR